MTRKEIYGIVIFFAVVIVGAAYLHAWKSSIQYDQFKKDLSQRFDSIDKRWNDEKAAIKHDEQTVKTPAQIAATVPKYTPGVRPILVISGGVPTEPSSTPTMPLPDAPSKLKAGDLVIPAEQTQAYWQGVTKCADNAVDLGRCLEKLPLETERADKAEKGMKGGSFLNRLKANSKFLMLGGVVAGVAICASGHCK